MSEPYRLMRSAPQNPPRQVYRKVEYKVLGGKPVEVVTSSGSSHESLQKALTVGNYGLAESILNALGAEGWTAIQLDPPYIFIREAQS